MKTTNNILAGVFFILITLQINNSNAQTVSNSKDKGATLNNSYNTAVGLRLGETSGLTVKHFLNGSSTALEGILGVWPYAIGVTGLYEKYNSTGVSGLNWYYGLGGHINIGYVRSPNYYGYYQDDRYYAYHYKNPGLGVGIDGIFGLEYKIPKAPFAFSFDLKPFVEINNSPTIFMALDPGFGAKFTF